MVAESSSNATVSVAAEEATNTVWQKQDAVGRPAKDQVAQSDRPQKMDLPFTLVIFFAGAFGFLSGAGKLPLPALPILSAQTEQVAQAPQTNSGSSKLPVTDQRSVRAGARTLGEQLGRQRLLVMKDQAQLANFDSALQDESLNLVFKAPETQERLSKAEMRSAVESFRLQVRAEDEVLKELSRVVEERGSDAPPVQLGIFPD